MWRLSLVTDTRIKLTSFPSVAFLAQSQVETNSLMASIFKKISAQALYTAIPQLISRITHVNVSARRLYSS
jgi:hypothetical protein